MESSVLQIVIFRDGSPVGTEVFLPGEYTVGSDDGCELVLAAEQVAQTHAVLTFREGRINLADAGGGPTGVIVNGQPLANGEVKSRDDVAIGPFLLKFRVVGQKKPPAAAKKAAPKAQATPKPQPLSAMRPPAPALVPPPSEGRPLTPALAPRQQTPVPLQRQPTPISNARGPALAAAAQPAPAVPPRPDTDFEITNAVQVPASLLQAASLASELKPEPAAAPALAPAPAPKPAVAPARPAAPAKAPKPRRTSWIGKAPRAAAPATLEAEGQVPQGPSLRVRVFWGRSMVGIHGFAFGRPVVAGAAEGVDVPLYDVKLPKKRFAFARVQAGKWSVRVPPGLNAYRFEQNGWKPAAGIPDGRDKASLLSLDLGEIVRMGDSRHSIEVRTDLVPVVPKRPFRQVADPQLYAPLAVLGVLGIAAALIMPQFKRDTPDFTPRQLAPVRALLKPPEKKKPPEEKKKPEEKEKEKEKKDEKVVKQEKPPETNQPKPKQVASNVNQALKAVQKITVAGPAVESLLKATSKLVGGPKGYGDKGMGYKISPLIGKPPIAMAGMGFGPGMGGFGVETKGIGGMRGMGNGEGGGIGAFASGGVGKGKVAGAVISAPSRKAEIHGQLDRELIAKVINEHMGEIRGCYERALLKETGLAGKLVLEWTIEPTGVVSEIKVKTVTLKGPEVPNCIVGSLRSWAFPKPKGGKVIVSYPFLFNSVGF